MKIRPSSFPALALCPCFTGNERESADANLGTLLHERTAMFYRGNEKWAEGLDSYQASQVEWVGGELLKLSGSFEMEKMLSYVDEGFNVVYQGTPDYVGGFGSKAVVVDLKFGAYRDCRLQVIAYALAAMQTFSKTTFECFVIHADGREIHLATGDIVSAGKEIAQLIESVEDPKKVPCANHYCQFCASQNTCPEVAKTVTSVVERYSPDELKKIEVHSSEIKDPEQMAYVLGLACLAEKWAESVRFHAREMIQKGTQLPGWTLKVRNRREVKDIMGAYQALDLSPEVFIEACTLSMGKLEKAVKNVKAISAKGAKEFIGKKIGDLIETKESLMLSRRGSKEEEQE